MAAPAPQHGAGERYAQLEEELQGTLMRALSEISTLPRVQSYERAKMVATDILSLTNAALSAFGRSWNDRQRDPIAVLPFEVTSACFSWLDLKSLISVSHVSQAWRNAALSDPSLWSEYTVSKYAGDTTAGLRGMLSRSDPLPFRLVCNVAVYDALMVHICSHIHRIEMLHLGIVQHDALVRLLEHDAPVLEGLMCRDYPKDLDPPVIVSWSSACAPRLRRLKLGRFLLPSGSVFRAMHVFHGTLPDGELLPGPLLSIFPALTELVLRGVTPIVAGLLAPLPRQLTKVELSSPTSGPIDYAGFIRACHALDLSYLHIEDATAVSDAVSLVMQAPDRLWDLGLVRETYLALGTGDSSYGISCRRPISLLSEPTIMAHLHRVTSLTLSLAEYAGLFLSASWARALPALTHFALVTVRPDALDRVHDIFDCPPIAAPALQSVLLQIAEDFPYERCPSLANVAPVSRSLAVPVLDDLTIRLHGPEWLAPADLASLSGLAQRVSVQDFSALKAAIILEARASDP